MNTFANPAADLQALLTLNQVYVRAVQMSDVRRFEEILADDFLCSLPDGSLIDKAGFLERTARPVTISNLECMTSMFGCWGTWPSFMHARRLRTRTDVRLLVATRMCGPGEMADGSPSPRT